MNVNGSRFELLLGRNDWGRCLDGDDESARTMGSWWDGAERIPPVAIPSSLPAWDGLRSELGIQPLAIELPRTPGESPLTLDARRAAAADRYGNVYRIGNNRQMLHVSPAGIRHESTFWPADPSGCEDERERERLDFGPLQQEESAPAESYLALAVTADDYLVVAFASGALRGFLSFDLMAGGLPMRTLWPRAVAFEPMDMTARLGGGVWVLDRTDKPGRRVLWELDCRLAVVTSAQTSRALESLEPDDFQPVTGAPRDRAPVTFPGGIELTETGWVIDPIAVEVLGEGAVLLLDRDAAGVRSRVVRLRRAGDVWRADASRWLDELPDPAHDFVYANARVYAKAEPMKQLLIATSSGNQARSYVVEDTPDAFILRGATELFPLRRFGGRALLSIRGDASYDSGIDTPIWTPIVHQPRARFGSFAEFVTPVFDSRELGTTWDRLLLDGCIPPDTAIDIYSRAGDECADLNGAGSPGVPPHVIGTWLPEPRPHLRSTGPELPWLRKEAAPATRRDAGVGTWELLLQKAHGRYLQLRIRLSTGSGFATPRLRALRVWSPRFSYPQRFLPAVYREDESSASLLERWLANCESTLTQIEDRVVNVEALFDARTAPAEALAWLAEWLDITLDPAWDEERRRLFVEYAMEFFRWRGTVHGISLALALAFDACFDRALFEPPDRQREGPQRIRVVEAYQTRLMGAAVAGDPGAATGLREVRREAMWTPQEGNSGLVDRYAVWLGRKATHTGQITPFSLVPPTDESGEPDSPSALENAQRWSDFFQATLGFVPTIGAAERKRWRNYLIIKYGSSADQSLDDVRLPRDWPAQSSDAEDWQTFSALADGAWARTRWQDFLARRYRRIERLNRAYATSWPSFDVVAIPDAVPATATAQTDWLQFERQVLPMHRTAHRFSVLLPVADVASEPQQLEARLGLARRIVELEKPAHTTFDVRFYWAFNRVGEARLGLDTLLGAGSRAPELIPAAVLGRAFMGSSFVSGTARPKDSDRLLITC
jgi:phage tail-like protein